MHRKQLPDNFNMEVSIPTDEDGYLDRACPNEVCEAALRFWSTTGKTRFAMKRCSVRSADIRRSQMSGLPRHKRNI